MTKFWAIVYCKLAKIPRKHNHDSPYHAPSAFLVPHLHRNMFKKELDYLISIGVFKQNANSQHTYPTFIITKKDGKVRFVSDFRSIENLNRGTARPQQSATYCRTSKVSSTLP